jgi:hypothetical protein
LVRPEWKASAAPSSTPSKSSGGNSKVNIYDAPTPLIRDSKSTLGSFGNDHQKSDVDDKQEAMDSVIDSIQQLSLVPRQIQFGKKAGSKSFQRWSCWYVLVSLWYLCFWCSFPVCRTSWTSSW